MFWSGQESSESRPKRDFSGTFSSASEFLRASGFSSVSLTSWLRWKSLFHPFEVTVVPRRRLEHTRVLQFCGPGRISRSSSPSFLSPSLPRMVRDDVEDCARAENSESVLLGGGPWEGSVSTLTFFRNTFSLQAICSYQDKVSVRSS